MKSNFLSIAALMVAIAGSGADVGKPMPVFWRGHGCRNSGKARRKQFTPGAFGNVRMAQRVEVTLHDTRRRHNEPTRDAALKALFN